MTEHVVVECVDHKCVILVTHAMHTYTYIHRVMSSQPTFSHKYSLQPGDEETTVTASTLNEMDREQYETLFAEDLLVGLEMVNYTAPENGSSTPMICAVLLGGQLDRSVPLMFLTSSGSATGQEYM